MAVVYVGKRFLYFIVYIISRVEVFGLLVYTLIRVRLGIKSKRIVFGI